MFFTPSVIITLVRLRQYANTSQPTSVTLFGIATFSKL